MHSTHNQYINERVIII